jgi:hypothetical protein
MAAARDIFYERIGLLRELSNDRLLTDIFPLNAPHNARATILRNGLIVSAFSLLERYLQDRIEENVAAMNNARMAYAMLGDGLRRLFSLDAIVGLANRINFVDRADRLTFAEAQIARLAALNGVPVSYTGLGFSPKGSNVSADDLHTLLAAFGVQNPWQVLARATSTLGATRVSLRDDFTNLARARNKAAHDSTTNVASADLETHLETVLLVGMSIDVVLTHATSAFVRSNSHSTAVAAANALPLSFRFLDQTSIRQWSERLGTGRVIKRYTSKDAAKSGALSRSGNALVVLRDQRSIPMELL